MSSDSISAMQLPWNCHPPMTLAIKCKATQQMIDEGLFFSRIHSARCQGEPSCCDKRAVLHHLTNWHHGQPILSEQCCDQFGSKSIFCCSAHSQLKWLCIVYGQNHHGLKWENNNFTIKAWCPLGFTKSKKHTVAWSCPKNTKAF